VKCLAYRSYWDFLERKGVCGEGNLGVTCCYVLCVLCYRHIALKICYVRPRFNLLQPVDARSEFCYIYKSVVE